MYGLGALSYVNRLAKEQADKERKERITRAQQVIREHGWRRCHQAVAIKK